MRSLTLLSASALVVLGLHGSAAAEILVANSDGHVWVLNDNLTTKADDYFGAVRDVSGLKDGSVLIATDSSGGRLYLRNPDLSYSNNSDNFGSFATTGLMGMSTGDALVTTRAGRTWALNMPGLTTHYYAPGADDVIVSAAELTNGNVVVASQIGNGYLGLKDSSLNWLASSGGYLSGLHVAGLSTGNVLVSNDLGKLWVRSGTDLSSVYSNDGFLPITAIAEFADGRIAVANANGRLYVRNGDLSDVAFNDGYGGIPELAAMPNGLMIVPSSTQGILRLVNSNGLVVNSQAGFGSIVSVAYVVAEPSTIVLLGMGALGFIAYAWRKQR